MAMGGGGGAEVGAVALAAGVPRAFTAGDPPLDLVKCEEQLLAVVTISVVIPARNPDTTLECGKV